MTNVPSVGMIHSNRLLAVYPAAGQGKAPTDLELVHLPAGRLLYDCGQRITYAYFPVTAVVSLMLLMKSGATMEIASVGDEGLVGLPLVMGGDVMPSRAEVRTGGLAYRIKASDLKRDFSDLPLLRTAILLYAQTMLTQVSQSSACNRHHAVSQQLCRWLLLSLDRAQSNQLSITHQSIANMLGVRREGVTEATGKLEQAGIIAHVRGKITVLDRARLDAACCECYAMVRTEFARLRERSVELAGRDDEIDTGASMQRWSHGATAQDAARIPATEFRR
jgi:CRP-like cAMP-binding protein